MRAFKEKPKKSKILERLGLTENQLDFHGYDSLDHTRRYNPFDNHVFRTFNNELSNINFVEINGNVYQVVRKGYECIVILVLVK